jgi:hypothetical protein
MNCSVSGFFSPRNDYDPGGGGSCHEIKFLHQPKSQLEYFKGFLLKTKGIMGTLRCCRVGAYLNH